LKHLLAIPKSAIRRLSATESRLSKPRAADAVVSIQSQRDHSTDGNTQRQSLSKPPVTQAGTFDNIN
jgi:hypothetical protein